MSEQICEVPERAAICTTCKYWDETGKSDFGWCRRHSPSTFVVQGGDPVENVKCYSTWPECHASNWCGEWRAKDDSIME